MSNYDTVFFDYLNSGSIGSAERVLPHLTNHMSINSVLDVGCGQGAWLAVWKRLGVNHLTGIDGGYVDRQRLLCPADSFVPRNLEKSFDLGRRFDLVESLEVAEHLPERRAASFVDDLVRHGDLVLFSAAARGQGGHNHINEQDYDYWRSQFARHGYIVLDYLRPLLQHEQGVEPWYRYNSFLYVSPERLEHLPKVIRSCRVADQDPLQDMSPRHYQWRKRLIRLLPVSTVTRLAQVKERYVAWARSH